MREGLDQIVSEYRRFRTAGRSPPATKFCLPDGSIIELCHTNGSDWTLCVLRPGDGALTPVAVGDDIRGMMDRYSEILDGWQPALWPPLSVVIEGVARVFMPAGMSLLLGVVELAGCALLLGVLKRGGKSCVALLHIAGHQVTPIHVGGPADLRSADVDGLLELQGGAIQAATGVLPTELLAAFARLLARALKPRKRAAQRRRSVGAFLLFFWILVQLVSRDSPDLYGRLGDIDAQIKAAFPGIDLPKDVLGDILALLLEIGTCLVSRDGQMLWVIRLSKLNIPGSPHHQKFCAEAPSIAANVEDFVRIATAETPPERSKRRCRSSHPEEVLMPEAGHTQREGGSEHSGSSTIEGDEGAGTDPPEPVLLAFLQLLLDRTANAPMPTGTAVVEPSGSGEAPPLIKK